jgi:chromate transporter
MPKSFEVFIVFLKLGLTSFGGPIAHLGFFHDEFVARRKWIDEHAYADLVALCQFLPGPASSQVGMSIGLSRAGVLGAIAAWIGFTLPSAILLVLFGLGISNFSSQISMSVLHGLKIVAVAIVAQAIWQMAPKLCPDIKRAILAILSGLAVYFISSAWAQVAVIVLAGIYGYFFLKNTLELPPSFLQIRLNKKIGVSCLAVFFSFLILLPIAAQKSDLQAIKYFDSFYRAGSLVFGGGHVVLPLLQSEVVPNGWVSNESFLAGYGAAQAVPGPLFTFSAYLGAVSQKEPTGWLAAGICLVAIFLPSFLLIFGTLPFWEQLRQHGKIRNAMLGVNAAVVGLLLAAFYNPVWSSAIFNLKDLAVAAAAFLLLTVWKVPSWAVVLGTAVIAWGAL